MKFWLIDPGSQGFSNCVTRVSDVTHRMLWEVKRKRTCRVFPFKISVVPLFFHVLWLDRWRVSCRVMWSSTYFRSLWHLCGGWRMASLEERGIIQSLLLQYKGWEDEETNSEAVEENYIGCKNSGIWSLDEGNKGEPKVKW